MAREQFRSPKWSYFINFRCTGRSGPLWGPGPWGFSLTSLMDDPALIIFGALLRVSGIDTYGSLLLQRAPGPRPGPRLFNLSKSILPTFHYIYLAQNLLKTRFSTTSPTCFEQVIADISQTNQRPKKVADLFQTWYFSWDTVYITINCRHTNMIL